MKIDITYKQQLEDWWAYEADSFPGSFKTWLTNRINNGDYEDLEQEIMILANEEDE